MLRISKRAVTMVFFIFFIVDGFTTPGVDTFGFSTPSIFDPNAQHGFNSGGFDPNAFGKK